MPRRGWVAPCIALAAIGCGGTLDAGRNMPHGLLPVDERNPVILDNDSWEIDWSGEYAMLFANSGGPRIVAIIASASPYWGDATINATACGKLIAAARASGLRNIPDVTMSAGLPLVRPADGQVDSTTPNNSAGAQKIVELSRELSTPSRPLVVLSAVPLTNLADAYLIDHSVVDRVVIVATLGELEAPLAAMNGPNGDLDAWADWIVAQKYKTYVQVSAYYDQTNDVTTADLPRLPDNPLGAWMRDKQPNLYTIPQASDQIVALSVALSAGTSAFVTAVQRASPDTSVAFDNTRGPPLRPDPSGNAWVVTQNNPTLAATKLWEMLLDPRTFAP
jgi:hypothetical protein